MFKVGDKVRFVDISDRLCYSFGAVKNAGIVRAVEGNTYLVLLTYCQEYPEDVQHEWWCEEWDIELLTPIGKQLLFPFMED